MGIRHSFCGIGRRFHPSSKSYPVSLFLGLRMVSKKRADPEADSPHRRCVLFRVAGALAHRCIDQDLKNLRGRL